MAVTSPAEELPSTKRLSDGTRLNTGISSHDSVPLTMRDEYCARKNAGPHV